MKVLHICSDYPYTTIYQQLLLHFFDSSISHIMYAPLMRGRFADPKYACVGDNALVLYSYDYNQLDRFRYHHKRLAIYKSIQKVSVIDNCEIIHAHFLFSAGGVAYELKKNKNIDYIVTVRNTDLNTFFKYAIHLRSFVLEIIDKAKYVIFISPAYRDAIIKMYIPERMKKSLIDKSVIMPNGIHDYWFDNISVGHKDVKEKVNFLFVGGFTENKNIFSIINAVIILRKKGFDAHLKLIGSGDKNDELEKIALINKDFIKIKSFVKSKDELLSEYRLSDIFIMPSFTETFGLVYIEALTQGLPIIYSKGQGVDGYFSDGEVGYACNPDDLNSIVGCAEKIIKNYSVISKNCFKSLNQFKWQNICRDYEDIYRSVSIS